MRFGDLLRFSLKAMTDRKLRTALTITGIVIGPAAIVALLASTQGFSNAVSEQFAKTGTTSIFVLPSERGVSLTSTDVAIMEKMSNVTAAVPFWLLTGTIAQGTQATAVQVMAGDFTKLTYVMPGLSLQAGSYPSSYDLGGSVIGYSVAYPNLAGAPNVSLNQIVTVSFSSFGGFGATGSSGEKSFIVRGIFNQFGQGFLIDPDVGIFVSLEGGQSILHTNKYSGIVVVASDVNTVNQVVSELTNEYGTKVRITAITSILSSIQSVLGGFSTILAAIGGISVIVAFVGIMTTMFTTVIERTKEIGILKALGYGSRDIMSIFLAESLTTGFIGGVIGAAVGSGLSYVVGLLFAFAFRGTGGGAGNGGGSGFGRGEGAGGGGPPPSSAFLNVTPVISPELLLLAIALATVVGALAGLLPAWRASRLTPVQALRTE
ncbi:MAG: ABC transporter permease [Thaumarchaeota archaeon]|nr:ABC transporter permease [Nitrososphaerota archaeon]